MHAYLQCWSQISDMYYQLPKRAMLIYQWILRLEIVVWGWAIASSGRVVFCAICTYNIPVHNSLWLCAHTRLRSISLQLLVTHHAWAARARELTSEMAERVSTRPPMGTIRYDAIISTSTVGVGAISDMNQFPGPRCWLVPGGYVTLNGTNQHAQNILWLVIHYFYMHKIQLVLSLRAVVCCADYCNTAQKNVLEKIHSLT